MHQIKTALFGLGTVNIGFLKILTEKGSQLVQRYGLEFIITTVADSSGMAISSSGFDLNELIRLKTSKKKVNNLEGYLPGLHSDSLVDYADAGLLIESSPVNLETGNPGLNVAKEALRKGWRVVLANKAPLVFAFDELHFLAKKHQTKLAYSATVCGGLPVINVIKRDLKGASLKSFNGILNATTNHILNALETGGSMDAAIKEAQRLGAAEADPMHDVHGHDAANKLFLIMKSFTDYPGDIASIEVKGIENITATQLADARKRGNAIKLIASATRSGGTWALSVKPTEVGADSFLGQCEGWEMGVQLETDYYESIAMKIYEEDPIATSAAVLRDAIDLVTG